MEKFEPTPIYVFTNARFFSVSIKKTAENVMFIKKCMCFFFVNVWISAMEWISNVYEWLEWTHFIYEHFYTYYL